MWGKNEKTMWGGGNKKKQRQNKKTKINEKTTKKKKTKTEKTNTHGETTILSLRVLEHLLISYLTCFCHRLYFFFLKKYASYFDVFFR